MQERLSQMAASLAAHPTSFDTILAVLQMILDNPDEQKFRRLRLSNRRFAATVAGAPGGIEFLLALGFARDTSQGKEALVHQRGDLGLLWLGKAVLEAQQQVEPYCSAKASLDRAEAAAQEEKTFRDAMAASSSTADAEEEGRREKFRRKVPNEPNGCRSQLRFPSLPRVAPDWGGPSFSGLTEDRALRTTGQTGASRLKIMMGDRKIIRCVQPAAHARSAAPPRPCRRAAVALCRATLDTSLRPGGCGAGGSRRMTRSRR